MNLQFPQPLVALFAANPNSAISVPIGFLTHGPVSHAAWLRSDGVTIHEADIPSVRSRPLADVERARIRLFRLDGMTPEIATDIERFFDLAVLPQFVEQYSIKGLFRYLFNTPPPDEQAVFCSEYIMQTVRKICPSLLPLVRCEDYQVAPNNLLWSPRLIEVSLNDLSEQSAIGNRQSALLA